MYLFTCDQFHKQFIGETLDVFKNNPYKAQSQSYYYESGLQHYNNKKVIIPLSSWFF